MFEEEKKKENKKILTRKWNCGVCDNPVRLYLNDLTLMCGCGVAHINPNTTIEKIAKTFE